MKVLVLLISRAVFTPDNELIHKKISTVFAKETYIPLEILIRGMDHTDNLFPEKMFKYFLAEL